MGCFACLTEPARAGETLRTGSSITAELAGRTDPSEIAPNNTEERMVRNPRTGFRTTVQEQLLAAPRQSTTGKPGRTGGVHQEARLAIWG